MGKCEKVSLLLLFVCTGISSIAQTLKQERLNPKNPIICYAGEEHLTHVPPPEVYDKLRQKATGRNQSAIFEVTYVGFTPEAQAAFQFAVDIWETQISSPVPIHVTAIWQPLDEGVLGSAIWGTLYANFPGAQQINTWYPVALAEKMAGRDLNGTDEIDILANFSSSANWYLQTTGTPPTGQYDLVTVVLHELGHGLGIVDTYNVADEGAAADGSVGFQSRPIIYDRYIENTSGQSLYLDFTSPSSLLKGQLTSNGVFFNSPGVLAVNGNQRGKIYAPTSYNGGSSISHLDESTYNGTVNSLMTPQIGSREVIHNPGPITLSILGDMGWVYTRIDHNPLKGSENVDGPYSIKAIITSEAGTISNPKVMYSTGGADVELVMTATGNPDEYEALIPGTGNPATFNYYIQTQDAAGRTFSNPGKRQNPGSLVENFYYRFSTGPDNQSPRITHSPKGFILANETQLSIEAIISDNIGIGSVTLDYMLNDVAQTPVTMISSNPDSLYSATMTFSSALSSGDVIKYKITAIDNSSNQNQAAAPANDYYQVNVVGLEPTQESYSNNFDSPSDDFFGDGFSITTPAGFTSGAIHTTHPYPQGTGFPNDRLDFTYQLKIPIRVQDVNATIKFDEIVLVEPGDDGTVFGDEDFFDYVVVEGSVDGGITWTPVMAGYDARADASWLSAYNLNIDGDNLSTAVGTPALFKPRTMNLLDSFEAGDEVVLRFHLFSDPLANGWGWSIDNLRIQIDDTPPLILSNHVDFLTAGTETLSLEAKATDENNLSKFWIEYQVNNDPLIKEDFILLPGQEDFSFTLGGTNSLSVGDVIKYKFGAEDMNGNTGFFPPENMIVVPIIEFSAPISTYSNNFNGTVNDFVGNFYSVTQPAGFADGVVQSTSPYPVGIGLDQTSNFNFILTKPIHINAGNPYIRFDEIAIIENHPGSAGFGTAAFKDYVVVEGSKDGGITWLPFLTGYDATIVTQWNNIYLTSGIVTPSLFRTRAINMLENGNFSADEDVLIRFRLFSDSNKNGAGWILDNLFIQDVVTGFENPSLIQSIRLYPNPATDRVFLRIESQETRQFGITILSAQGMPLQQQTIHMDDVVYEQEINTSDLPNGVYLIKVTHQTGSTVRKLIVTR